MWAKPSRPTLYALYFDVDLPEHSEKVEQYKVNGIPLVLILNPDGTIRRQAYSMTAEEAVEFLTAKSSIQ